MQIYVARDGQQLGPFDLDTVRAGLSTGTYAPDQLGWYDGAPGWMPLAQVPGLEPAKPSLAPPPSVPPPPPVPMMPSSAQSWQQASRLPQPGLTIQPSPQMPPASGPSAGTLQTTQPVRPGAGSTKTILIIAGAVLIALFGMWKVWQGVRQVAHALAGGSRAVRSVAASTPYPASYTAPTAAPSYTAAPARSSSSTATGTRRFVNDRSKCQGTLLARYTDFSFNYPANWVILEQGGSGSNFVTLSHQKADASKDDLERVSFGFFFEEHGKAAESLPSVGPVLMKQVEPSLAKGFPAYQRAGQGMATFGQYRSHALTFTSRMVDPKATVDIWGRVDIYAPPTGGNGVVAMVLATSGSTEVHGLRELGNTGGLQTIISSFRFGK